MWNLRHVSSGCRTLLVDADTAVSVPHATDTTLDFAIDFLRFDRLINECWG